MRSMIRRRRSDEGRRMRKIMMAQGLGDHLPFSFKAYEFDTPPLVLHNHNIDDEG